MRYIVFVLLIMLGTNVFSQDKKEEIRPFTTDGCTMFPDGWGGNDTLWRHCCVSHDSAYWKGGTKRDRLIADSLLRECVTREGYPKISSKMFVGVRIFGGPSLPTPWRWGYGWEFGKGYDKE